jgi:hypothetical protein
LNRKRTDARRPGLDLISDPYPLALVGQKSLLESKLRGWNSDLSPYGRGFPIIEAIPLRRRRNMEDLR